MKTTLSILIGSFLIVTVSYGQTGKKKTLHELTNVGNNAWAYVQELQSTAKNKIEILPRDSDKAAKALVAAQLPTNTTIGAVIYNSGGIIVDNGWIRILGSGSEQLTRSLPEWNKGKSFLDKTELPGYVLIADDILGGFFAIKANNISELEMGDVYYFGPNGLNWQPVGLRYATFLNYCFSGDLKDFYGGFRWDTWEADVSKLNGDQVFSCFPLLWTKEGIALTVNRKIRPVQKQWDLYHGVRSSDKLGMTSKARAKK